MDKKTDNFIKEIKETFNQSFSDFDYAKDFYLEATKEATNYYNYNYVVNFTIAHKKFGEMVLISITYAYILLSAKTIRADFFTDFIAVACWQKFMNALAEKIKEHI